MSRILCLPVLLMSMLPLTASNPAPAELLQRESWPEKGSLVVDFQLNEDLYRQGAKDGAVPLIEQPLLEFPIAKIQLSNRLHHIALGFELRDEKGQPSKWGSVMLSRLEGGKPYQLVLSWDVTKNEMEAYLNGTLQQPLFILGDEAWAAPPSLRGNLKLLAKDAGQGLSIQAKLGRMALLEHIVGEEEAAQLAAQAKVPDLAGEGRTVYTEPLEVEEGQLKLLFEPDFSAPLDVVGEDSLFDGEQRVQQPKPDQWVLEGKGKAFTQDGWLVLEAQTDPNDTSVWLTDGHLVLWQNRVFPDNILIEYEMSPYDSGKGLNIVFFGYRPNNGEASIFAPSIRKREGQFQNYLFHDVAGYHTSVWACPKAKRRTTNMRKNTGFHLVAIGNDHITDQGPGPHRIRIYKNGGHIVAETNGIIAMEYEDDGKTFGPIHRDGYFALRMMAQSNWIKIRHLKVYEITE